MLWLAYIINTVFVHFINYSKKNPKMLWLTYIINTVFVHFINYSKMNPNYQ